MKSLSISGCAVGFFVLCLLAAPAPAFGYIDPGTGSMVLQVLIGTALGSLLAIKMFWRQIKLVVGGLFARKSSEAETVEAPQTEATTVEASQTEAETIEAPRNETKS